MIRYFAAHPTASNLLMLMLIVLGLFSLPQLKRETFPDFTSQEIQITVPYPGASPEDVEEAICLLIENALDGINDVEEVRCQALENRAVAVAKMTESGDLQRFLDDTKTEIEAIDEFPDQAESPIIQQLARTDAVASIAVTGPMSAIDLKAYAEQLKKRLQQRPHISQVNIQGFSQHQFQVRVSARALLQYGLSVSDLAQIIEQQSLNMPAGSIESRERDFLIRFMDQRRSIAELENLVVLGATESGGEVRLGDIAEILDQFQLDEDKILFNGQRAAILQVAKTKAQDTLTVMDSILDFVEYQRQIAPPGVQFTITQDISSIVRDRLNMLLVNGIQGLILVFLVMWLFFRLRFAFWVAMGLPVSFLGGLFVMNLMGHSINMISMVALLIATGLLMDDAIVIAENIASKLKKGLSALDAAVEGTREVMPGVLSSFLTSTAVFLPMAFISGDMGKVLKVIPAVLIAVLAVSLIEAFMILPHHLAHSLKHHENQPKGRFRSRFEERIEWLRQEVLGRTIDRVIEWRYLFMGGVIAVFLASLGMLAGGYLKFQAFPDIEGDIIEARILLPQGTPLWRTEEVVDQLQSALVRVDKYFRDADGYHIVAESTIQYNQNLDANETGPHVATLKADLISSDQRKVRINEILQRWRNETGIVADAIAINYKEPTIGPAGLPVEIRLVGEDLATLKSASLELQDWLRQYRGVFNLSDDLRPGKPELRLSLLEGTYALGLNASMIASQLRAGFYGMTADEIQIGPESYEIDVGLLQRDKSNLDDLREFRILTHSGEQVPLGSIVSIEPARGFARIHRINGLRTLTITGDVDPHLGNVNQILGDTEQRFLNELRERYPDILIRLKGQTSETAETGGSMANGFLIGLVGIFILLSFQFRSYIEPLAVMSIIPLAMIGVIWGHLLMGLELSMPSMMGAISLAGIVVNDSILLVVFLKLRAHEGRPIPEAAKMASRERFRAVLLTSLTTIAGLTPLLTETSLQAQVLIPLAASIIFGLLASTLLVLLVVPSLFSIFNDFGWVTLEKEMARDDPEQALEPQ
jgi:multidrug efflux pump subunit AcrB